jgi:hypothetical protein
LNDLPTHCAVGTKRNVARRQRYAGYRLAEDLRYNERSGAERNGRLKDDFGGRYVRVRGHAKVLCHLTFATLWPTQIEGREPCHLRTSRYARRDQPHRIGNAWALKRAGSSTPVI